MLLILTVVNWCLFSFCVYSQDNTSKSRITPLVGTYKTEKKNGEIRFTSNTFYLLVNTPIANYVYEGVYTSDTETITLNISSCKAGKLPRQRLDIIVFFSYNLSNEILDIAPQKDNIPGALAYAKGQYFKTNNSKTVANNVRPQSKDDIKRQKKELKYFNKVMKSNDYNTRKNYTGLIEGEELLYRIATEHGDRQTIANAANRIYNEELLYRIAIRHKDKQVIDNLVNKINNEELLYQLIQILKDNKVRLDAVEKITDLNLLKKVVDSTNVITLRVNALSKIDDQSYLYQYALVDEDYSISNAAIKKLNEEMLQKIVADTIIGFSNKLAAINRISDQQFLFGLVGDEQLRPHVIEKITSQDLLLKIAQENKNFDTRKIAFNKLDTVTLEKVAKGTSKDRALEVAAKIILNRTNWDTEFSNKSSEYLGYAIGAAALIDNNKNQPTSASVVKACHTYIRRGDKSRISELRDLLLRYGDKALAEDYLNCGNNELYEAAREWGSRRGYNIGAGYGSNRVRWGSGR